MGQIVVSGGTGFIGRALVRALLARGDNVTVVTRDKDKVATRFGNDVRATHWDSGHGVVASLVAKDAMVHLAGSQAVGVRYSYQTKREMIASRVHKAERLVQAMRQGQRFPRVFVCASAVGYYGPHEAHEELDENSPAGNDFLARLCVDWEAAAKEAESLGVRVVIARMGIVLGKGGGVLSEMVKPFQFFMGGPIGSGQQVMSWVHMDDAVGMLMHCLDDEFISGPVNITAPNPVSNQDMANAIGKQLNRGSKFRVPEALLRWRFGDEGVEAMLKGQRVLPRVMQARGYQWKHPEVSSALAEALG